MQANKNGYFYVIDRISGEFISGEPMAPVSWARGLDPKTGRPDRQRRGALHGRPGRDRVAAPDAQHGADGVQSGDGARLRPDRLREQLLVYRHQQLRAHAGTSRPGDLRGRGDTGPRPPLAVPPAYGPDRALGARETPASSPRGIRPRKQSAGSRVGGGQSGGGALSTASNLVFQVTPQGRLLVYTADKGEKLLDIESAARPRAWGRR